MRKFLFAFALILLPFAPARAQFCPGVAPWVFVDVAASHAFCTYVTWMAQNNVTSGCRIIDANNREYCPDDNVTRLQMAAFMNRLGNALFPLTCAPGQVMKWNGLAWACDNDNIGGSGGGGTVTSVAAGTGLQASPNPITTAGAINLAPGYQLPQSCANGQVAKSNGAGGWTCAADIDTNSGGTVTSVTAGAGLTGGTITTAGTIAVNTATIQARVTGTCAVGSSIRAIASDGNVTCETDDAGPTNAFVHNGNAFGGEAVLGTTDNFALDVRVNNARVMRFEPNAESPNLVGGYSGNFSHGTGSGQTIGGGGSAGNNCGFPSRDCRNATAHLFATVGGGSANQANGQHSFVGGGYANTASGHFSTVAGGGGNIASGTGSTVAGGGGNVASGVSSFAAGSRAKTQTADAIPVVHDGAFVWADGSNFDFNTAATNEFAVRATGGVRFVTAIDGIGAPTRTLRVNPNAELEFGAITRQMLNLYGGTWGIGVQPSTQYFRSGDHFGWYLNGAHSDSPLDPGAGGAILMTLTNGASISRVTGTLRAQVVTATSDRAQKLDFAAVDGQEVLARVVSLPIETWAYRNEPGVRHMGPTGQAFQAAFGLGHDDTSIATVDADGVALAAIKGLNEKLETTIAAQAHEIEALRTRNSVQDSEVAELRRMVELLLARTAPDGQIAHRR